VVAAGVRLHILMLDTALFDLEIEESPAGKEPSEQRANGE
jgi:hypothetical protein